MKYGVMETRWILIGAGVLALAGLAYWQLILAEGVYLGSRTVVLLYDLVARRYDKLKSYQPASEDLTLGWPLARRLANDEQVTVLDVATGTGRLPMSLLRQADFRGRIVGLDLSEKMLERAAENLAPYGDRVEWLKHDASRLPFESASFDAVTSVEAMEFLPDPAGALREMVRVLKPGGTLLFTNRVGVEALFLPGKVFTAEALRSLLVALPLRDVEIMRWEVDYDQIWAYRAEDPADDDTGGVTVEGKG